MGLVSLICFVIGSILPWVADMLPKMIESQVGGRNLGSMFPMWFFVGMIVALMGINRSAQINLSIFFGLTLNTIAILATIVWVFVVKL